MRVVERPRLRAAGLWRQGAVDARGAEAGRGLDGGPRGVDVLNLDSDSDSEKKEEKRWRRIK